MTFVFYFFYKMETCYEGMGLTHYGGHCANVV